MKVRLLLGDARDRLHDLEDDSVHCCITSPPYWGRRTYHGEAFNWIGYALCAAVPITWRIVN